MNDRMQDLKSKYEKTLPEKIDLLSKLVKFLQNSPDETSLIALKSEVHKIAGSAGTYGFPEISTLCKGLEHDIYEKLSSGTYIDEEWLSSLDTFLNHFKIQSQALSSADNPKNIQPVSSPQLYIVDSDLKFVELIEREKGQFSMDIEVETDPKKAIVRLKSPDFNPKAIIVSYNFPNSYITGYDIIELVKHKSSDLETIFGLLFDSNDANVQSEAMRQGIKHIFPKPISVHTMLQAMVSILT